MARQIYLMEMVICACGCGQMHPLLGWDGEPKKFISGHNVNVRLEDKRVDKIVSEKIRGSRHWNWKGGKYLTDTGYIRVLVGPKRYRFEHRIVMEENLGRKLKSSELVHHINGNKTDNRKKNLEIMTRSQYNRDHKLGGPGGGVNAR